MNAIRTAIAVALALGAGAARAATEYYPPLSSQVDVSSLPADAIRAKPDGGKPIPERIRVKQFLYQELKNPTTKKDIGARITLDLLVSEVFDLEIPGLENVLSIAFGTGAMKGELVMREEHATNPDEDYPFILSFVPGENLVAIRFKSDVLKPVQPITYQPYSGTPPIPELRLSAGIKIQLRYSWDGDPDVQLIEPGGLRPKLSLSTPVEIGDTGMVLEVDDAEIDFSRTSSPPGRPATWTGVFFHKLAINFVNGLDVPKVEHGEGAAPLPPSMAGITLTDFSIGSGGVSGGICGNLSAGPTLPLFGSDFQLRRLCVTLDSGALTAGEVSGTLSQFPFFKAPVNLTLALALDGNFKVGLSPPDPQHPAAVVDLPIPSVLTYHLEALSIEKKGDLYLWKTSGKLNVNAISTAPADAMVVNGLTVTSKGEVTLEGGWLVLPGKKSISFKGFAVELSEIGFGNENPGSPGAQAWVGFSGGVELSKGFDAASKFKRLQFLWPGTGAAPVDVKLQGVEVSFKRPGVMSFDGAVDFFKDATTGAEGFAGKLTVNVEAVKLSIEGRLVVGKATPPTGTQFPFFYIDLAAQLPTGIPLYGNVSLYGFLGLFAYNVGPNIQAFTTPVQWFEAHRVATNVLAGTPPPWKAADGAFAVGAGAILGTMADDGYSVNTKIAVMVSLPGPVVMLQGAANIVKKRGDLTSSTVPNFVCLAIFDGNANTFLINIGAYYSVPNLIEIKGEAEAFYDIGNPVNWHLWIGKDQPEDRRIGATVISFLHASAYFMLEPPLNVKQGGKAGYQRTWKFGPLHVSIDAYFAYDMKLTYRPEDAWGQLEVKGDVELKAFGIGVGLCVNAVLQGEAPRPLYIDGKFHVKLSLPWPLPDPSADVHLHWEAPKDKEPLEELVSVIGVEPRKGGATIQPDTASFSAATTRGTPPATILSSSLCAPGQSVLAAGQTTASCSRPLVPMDVLMTAAFQRPTNDPAQLGWGNPFDPGNPRKDLLNDTEFRYDLQGYELVQAKKGAATLTFDTPLSELFAAWPAITGAATATPLYLKILSRNPIDVYQSSTLLFYGGGTKGWTEWALDHYGNEYCVKGVVAGGGGLSTSVVKDGCRVPPGVLSQEDFVLPPYSAFRLTVDSDVTRNTSGPDRIYRNTAIFHTEGPPLDLAPYVDVTVPMDDRRPHYRGYDIGVRFNETYMDLMYRQDGQALQLQLTDENDVPPALSGSEASFVTDWETADDHVPRPTEDDWLQFLRDHGVQVDAVTPKDDRVFGRISNPAALRGNERYRARVWLDDARLAGDTRVGDAAWLAQNRVRFKSGARAVLFDFPLLVSRFDSFSALVGSYPGNFVPRKVAAAGSLPTAAAAAQRVAGAVATFPATLSNANGSELGRFLRHVLAPRGPSEVSDAERNAWIRRAPGYQGKPERMTDAERTLLLAAWEDALGAYDAVEKEFAFETFRLPLPKRFEVYPLVQGSDVIGLLCESPEAIDFTRVELAVQPVPGTPAAAALVPNRDSTRFFVFRPSGASLSPWANGLWTLRFTFHRTVGKRYPVLRAPDALAAETPTLGIDLPNDQFVPPPP